MCTCPQAGAVHMKGLSSSSSITNHTAEKFICDTKFPGAMKMTDTSKIHCKWPSVMGKEGNDHNAIMIFFCFSINLFKLIIFCVCVTNYNKSKINLIQKIFNVLKKEQNSRKNVLKICKTSIFHAECSFNILP